MQEEDRRRIAKHRSTLCRLIEFQELVPFLIQKNILTESVVDDIQSNNLKNEEQVGAMLTELEQPFVSRKEFDNFVECLTETNQGEAALLIRPKCDVSEFGSNSSPPQSLTDQPRLLVKKADSLMAGDGIYRMISRPRGYWVIINNSDFEENRYESRKGSEKDAKRMEEVASELGFDVKSKTNLTADEMYDFLMALSKEEDLVKHDAIVVQVMSHGEYDEIAGSDGVFLSVSNMKELFDGRHCEALAGKPKVFIFVACRGPDIDGNTNRKKCSIDRPGCFISSFESKRSDAAGGNVPVERIRNPSGRVVGDTLTAYSTSPGYVSHRHPEDGTYYISALARNLMERSCDTHLVDLLGLVDKELDDKLINDEYKQTCGFDNYGFNKKLYFNPGHFDTEL
jgi:caspase-like apoptosis-related cysteine protease